MSCPYYGDFPTNHTSLCMVFDAFALSTGAPTGITNFAAADVQIYKDLNAVQRSSSAGIGVTGAFDAVTGWGAFTIDLSDNTDPGFYAAGHEYQVGINVVTIDGQAMTFWCGVFSIERAGGVLALMKATTLASIKTDTAAIKVQTDKLTFTVANQVDVNVLDWKSAAAPAMTGDAFARLGAPAGASVSADTAAVKVDTAAIKLKTDQLTFTVANALDVNTLRINGVRVLGDGVAGSAPMHA